MSERPRFHHSVFGKLLAIMITMAVSLLLLVTLFLVVGVLPVLNRAVEKIVEDDVRRIAASQPDFETAKRLARELDLQIRYEGPDGQWTTAKWLPTAHQVKLGGEEWLIGGSGAQLARAPNGGTYLFYWTWRQRTISAHRALFHLFLVLMVATIIVTHLVIRRLLRPLRTLGDGVARLSEGELDVVLPAPTRDEFGVLTNAFNEMVGRVRAMIRARDQLLLDVSHELRSPLTRMRVAVELLPEGPDRRDMTADIVEMETMISELLELERLRNGRGIRTAPHDLSPIVRDVVGSFQDKAPGVRIASMPDEVIVNIDAEKIRSVLRNLVDNAVKYSLPDSAPVEVSAAADERSVVVRVTDDGPGIPEEDRATIFEPFFRVDRSRSRTTPGYGLGLSICRHVIEAHGGTIDAQNRPGRGTVFEIVLPKN